MNTEPSLEDLPQIEPIAEKFKEYYQVLEDKKLYERLRRTGFVNKNQKFDHGGSFKSVIVTSDLVHKNHFDCILVMSKENNIGRNRRRREQSFEYHYSFKNYAAYAPNNYGVYSKKNKDVAF